MSINLMVE